MDDAVDVDNVEIDMVSLPRAEWLTTFQRLDSCSLNEQDAQDEINPVARSGHRLVCDGANVYALGGYNSHLWGEEQTEDSHYPILRELWCFNLARRRWKKMKTTGPMPKSLASHSVVLWHHLLIMFGGTGVPFGDTASNELHMLDMRTLIWTQIESTGERPSRGYGQGIFCDGRTVYVVGGTTGWEYNMEVHCFSLRKRVWTKIQANSEDIDPRYRHEIVVYKKKLYVFGGGTGSHCCPLDKIPVLDMETKTWAIKMTLPDVNTKTFPLPRKCHSCDFLNGVAYICGGYDVTKIMPDCWALNLDTLQWRLMRAQLKEPVYFHESCLHPYNNSLLLFGGVTLMDDHRTNSLYRTWIDVPSLKDQSWEKVQSLTRDNPACNSDSLRNVGVPEHFVTAEFNGYRTSASCG